MGGWRYPVALGLAATVLTATTAQAHFLQTDPVGYRDDLNLYAYVRGDPINNSDPTGLTCTGEGENTACGFDGTLGTPSPTQRREMEAFSKAYTDSVKTLEAAGGRTVVIEVGGKRMIVTAQEAAQTMRDRIVIADPQGRKATTATDGLPGTAVTSREENTSWIGPRGLAGQIDPSLNPQSDRMVTSLHEMALHGGPEEWNKFPTRASMQPTIDVEHGVPYDNGSKCLLGLQAC